MATGARAIPENVQLPCSMSDAAAGEALFLDALDEYRTIASGQDASAEGAKALCKLAICSLARLDDWPLGQGAQILRNLINQGDR